MSKMRKISGQATSLGVASLVALVGWCSLGMAQDAAAPAAKAAQASTPVAQAKKPANAPGEAIAAQKKGPGADAAAGPHKPEREKKAEQKSDKDGHGEAKEGRGPGGKEKAGLPRPKLQPISREEAIEHYRTAQKALTSVDQPTDLKSDAAAEARKERREAMRELRRARDEILRSHNEARRDFQKRDPEEVEGLRKTVAKRTAQLRKDRKDRAKAEREEVAKLVGSQPLHPSVREELRSHAWRIARLNQLVYLAELDKKEKLGEKAKELIEKENSSHEVRLKALLAKPEVKNYKPPAREPSALKAKPGVPSKLPAGHPPIPAPAAQPVTQPAGANK